MSGGPPKGGSTAFFFRAGNAPSNFQVFDFFDFQLSSSSGKHLPNRFQFLFADHGAGRKGGQQHKTTQHYLAYSAIVDRMSQQTWIDLAVLFYCTRVDITCGRSRAIVDRMYDASYAAVRNTASTQTPRMPPVVKSGSTTVSNFMTSASVTYLSPFVSRSFFVTRPSVYQRLPFLSPSAVFFSVNAASVSNIFHFPCVACQCVCVTCVRIVFV